MKENPRQVLLKYWGYSSFRIPQEEIIDSVLDGRDTLALLPTGGGKSICFQVPGMILKGVCLVVTPLIALMKDQAEGLKRRGIEAEAIYSGMPREQITRILDNCLYGNVKFLYLSPERLATEVMRDYIDRMEVSILAVDEAHCIAQWGYDFRPPYLEIARIRELIPQVPVIALTATATTEVVKDIQEKLAFREENLFSKSFERKNLVYYVFREENKMDRLLRILDKTPGSGIIYVRNRKQTREIDEFLRRNGYASAHYHAGVPAADRHQRQEAWLNGKVRVIVATNAFGMGIDKPDVRFVVHLDLPDSLEAYFQEAGRAGRDGNRSYAVILFEEADIRELERFQELSFPPLETVKTIYRQLGNYCGLALGSGRDAAFDFDIDAFSSRFKLSRVIVHHALMLLEKEGYIMMSPFDQGLSRLQIILRPEDLYRFQVAEPAYDPFIKLLLRSYSGIMSEPVTINERELARRINDTEERLIKALRHLERLEVLRYQARKTLPQVVYTTERLDEKNLDLSPGDYRIRKEAAAKRLDSVKHYVRSTTNCRSSILLAYFGEADAPRCGRCDICVERNKTGLNELEFDRIVEKVKPLLQQSPLFPEEIIKALPGLNEDHLLSAISWLRDAEKIRMDAKGKYFWK